MPTWAFWTFITLQSLSGFVCVLWVIALITGPHK
jgi:hypothetical protein